MRGSAGGREGKVAWWLGWTAFLVVLLVQIPGAGNIDTARRMQLTRSLWTAEPPVREGEYPSFGLRGRDGVIHPWYGIGQSLVMLPADVVAAGVERGVSDEERRRTVRSVVVTTLTFPLLNALTVVLAWGWLGQLGMGSRERFWGAVSLLLGTTFLHYAQVPMENSLQDFLLFADAYCWWRWLATGRRRWLAGAAGAVGFGLLVRLTVLGEHGAVWLGGLGWWLTEGRLAGRGWEVRRRLGQLAVVAVPVVGFFVGVDRWVQHDRFGTWRGTYIDFQAAETRSRDPKVSADYPFDGEFLEGFSGPLVALHRSVFLYDPLLILLGVVLLTGGWKRIGPGMRWVVAGGVAGFLVLVTFYARCSFWHGSASWGNRYTLPPVHLLAVLAVPLALATGFHRRRWGRMWVGGTVAIAVVLQGLSVLMPSALERAQVGGDAGGGWVPAQRAENVWRWMRGEGPPAGVPEALWRINLTPSTVGAALPRWRPGLWMAWLGGWGLAGAMAWRTVREIRKGIAASG